MTVDELGSYGVERMDDAEISGFLSSHSVGVLGLPAEGAPYLLPLSFGYDGESRLYFVYVLGAQSQKDDLTARAEVARFLVYSVETMFNWRSVLLTGEFAEVDADDDDALRAVRDVAWRPDLFEQASETEATRLYQFRITEQSGIKHTGLPAGFADEREA